MVLSFSSNRGHPHLLALFLHTILRTLVNNKINHGNNFCTDTCKSSEVTGETTRLSATNTGECTIRPTTHPEKMAKGGCSTVVLVDITTTKTTEDPVEQFQKLFGQYAIRPRLGLKREIQAVCLTSKSMPSLFWLHLMQIQFISSLRVKTVM